MKSTPLNSRNAAPINNENLPDVETYLNINSSCATETCRSVRPALSNHLACIESGALRFPTPNDNPIEKELYLNEKN